MLEEKAHSRASRVRTVWSGKVCLRKSHLIRNLKGSERRGVVTSAQVFQEEGGASTKTISQTHSTYFTRITQT